MQDSLTSVFVDSLSSTVNLTETFNLVTYLENNSLAIQTLFAILIFFATVTYVIINTLMHREMVKQRKREETPNISIKFVQEPHALSLFALVIENISSVEVFNLIFIEYPELELWTVDGTTADVGIIKEGIEYMGVGQIYQDSFLELFDKENQNRKLDFKVAFFNKAGKKYFKSFSLNTAMFNSIGEIQHPTVEEELKKLRELIEKISTNRKDTL